MAIRTDLGIRQEDFLDSDTVRLKIEQLLVDSTYHELRQVHVEVTPEQIGLTGTVPTFFIKQVAQETVRQACGIRKIHNRIDVS